MKVRGAFLLLISAGFLAACASYTEDLREIKSLYVSGNYASADRKLDDSGFETQARNRLLFNLERAMIQDRLGNRKDSRRLLLNADRIADELYTVSISKTAASFVYNDAVTDYAGEDYEVVAIHTMLALSFIEDGLFKEARVEAVKINNKLHEINQRYEDKPNKYAQDAFALYLSGLIFERQGELDDALIDYRKSLGIYEKSFRGFYSGSPPDHLIEALARIYLARGRRSELAELSKEYPKITAQAEKSGSEREAQVIVIHELGEIAGKSKKEFILPISNQVVRFSFPVVAEKSYSDRGRTGMFLSGSGRGERFLASENLEDFNGISHQTLEDKRLRVIVKASARLLAKGQVTYQAEKNFGAVGWLAGTLYSTLTETADTRSWSLLPGAINMSRAWVEPGTYEVEMLNEGKKTKKRITLKPGELIILRNK